MMMGIETNDVCGVITTVFKTLIASGRVKRCLENELNI